MTKTNLSKVLLFCTLAGLFFACSDKKQQFTITGEIQGENGKMLYLEHIGPARITLLDSVKLAQNTFTFRQPRPQTPDFYRLRLGNQIINLVVDSTETITVTANTGNFATDYMVDENATELKKLKELMLLQYATSQKYNALQKQYEDNEISMDLYIQEANAAIDNYKTVARGYIISNFLAPSAYFALFQQVNNLLLFDLYNKEDSRLFGAVANAWNQAYPDSPRALQLKHLFTNSLAVLRGERTIEMDANETDGKDFLDIVLPSLDGQEIRLSEIGKGKVVLIDFTAYEKNDSPIHTMRLAELYDKYQSRGFEIYQISLDADEHFWKNAAVNLPWICVKDPESIYSAIAQRYNVREIPTIFIMNQDGEIVSRIEDYSALEKEIVRYFK
jgi:peroxiredoxin